MTNNKIKITNFVICALTLVIYLCFDICHSRAMAQSMSGSDYDLRDGIPCLAGPGAGSSSYELENVVGVSGIGAMSGSLYGVNAGFYNLNSLPLAAIANYNEGVSVADETPTLRWVYSDADNDTQKRYQLQLGSTGFESPLLDTGMVSSAGTFYTTSTLPLPHPEEKTVYKWRVRVDDGFSWSGWSVADDGFFLTTGGFRIGGLTALTAPGGEVIAQASWQKDSDPYFYWEAPSEGIEVLGYSYSLDAEPDDEIDSTRTYYYFPQGDIGDGAHTFYVKAQRLSGLWGEPGQFSIWVDTIAPTVSSFTPTLGGVIANDQPQVRAVLSDAASGVNPETIEMRINQARVTPEYDPTNGTIIFTPAIPFSEGEIVISLEASDAVGNSGLPLSWSFVVDTEGPTGTILINNGDQTTTTNMVTLNISADDDVTAVAYLMLSNDGVFDTEVWESYTSLRKNWAMPAVNGTRKVYAMLKDEAGNLSEAFFDAIKLVIVAPDTFILTGPSGVTELTAAQFNFRASLDDCQFSYKFDNGSWSDWSDATLVSRTSLSEGNHYFIVRSAKDLNKDGILQLEEVDPTPALRTWTISVSGLLKPSVQPEKPVKIREEE